MTKAHMVAWLLGNSGRAFQVEINGEAYELDALCRALGATEERYRRHTTSTGDTVYIRVGLGERTSSTVTRFSFDDGSAIVAAGDAWDIEGETLCSWAGA